MKGEELEGDEDAASPDVLEDVQPARAFVVHAGEDSYPISDDIEAIGLRELAGLLSRKTNEGE